MAFSYRELLFGDKTFCCCLPVRFAVIIMSLLGIVLAGALSIVLWFEIADSLDMTGGERVGFVVAALVETIFFLGCIFGFIVTVIQKPLFVQIYAYFIYIHSLLNIGVTSYLLFLVTRFSKPTNTEACQNTITDQQAESQCVGLLRVAAGAYYAITTTLLIIELCMALIVMRYVDQIKTEKSIPKTLYLDNEAAFVPISKGKGRYSSIPGRRDIGKLQHNDYATEEFDPYDLNPLPAESSRRPFGYDGIHGHSDRYDFNSLPAEGSRRTFGYDDIHQPPTEEVGYGGGSWTHQEIGDEEKARLKRMEVGTAPTAVAIIGDEKTSRWGKDVKSPLSPVGESRGSEDLPRYSPSGRVKD